MLETILMVIALILLLLAAINVPQSSRVSLGWLGLFFAFLAIFAGSKFPLKMKNAVGEHVNNQKVTASRY